MSAHLIIPVSEIIPFTHMSYGDLPLQYYTYTKCFVGHVVTSLYTLLSMPISLLYWVIFLCTSDFSLDDFPFCTGVISLYNYILSLMFSLFYWVIFLWSSIFFLNDCLFFVLGNLPLHFIFLWMVSLMYWVISFCTSYFVLDDFSFVLGNLPLVPRF